MPFAAASHLVPLSFPFPAARGKGGRAGGRKGRGRGKGKGGRASDVEESDAGETDGEGQNASEADGSDGEKEGPKAGAALKKSPLGGAGANGATPPPPSAAAEANGVGDGKAKGGFTIPKRGGLQVAAPIGASRGFREAQELLDAAEEARRLPCEPRHCPSPLPGPALS